MRIQCSTEGVHTLQTEIEAHRVVWEGVNTLQTGIEAHSVVRKVCTRCRHGFEHVHWAQTAQVRALLSRLNVPLGHAMHKRSCWLLASTACTPQHIPCASMRLAKLLHHFVTHTIAHVVGTGNHTLLSIYIPKLLQGKYYLRKYCF